MLQSSARCGPKDVKRDALGEGNLLEATEMGFMSIFYEC